MSSRRRRPWPVGLADPSRSRVFVVGVSQYTELEKLPTVAKGAQDLAALLRNKDLWGVPEKNCTVLLNPTNPTDVLNSLSECAQEAQDTLVVYFAGHGLLLDDDDLHLAFASANYEAAHRSLRYADLRSLVMRCKARKKVVIIDCCFSGKATELGMGPLPVPPELPDIEGSYLLTSSSATERSMAPRNKDYPAFTGELIKALDEGLEDGSELITTEALYQVLHERLPKGGFPLPQQLSKNNGPHVSLVRNRKHDPGPSEMSPGFTNWRRVALALPVAFVSLPLLWVGVEYAPWPPTDSPSPSATASGDADGVAHGLPHCSGTPDLQVTVAVSADLATPLTAAAKRYGQRSSGGKCVQVVVEEQNSGTMMRALTQGSAGNDGSLPNVWSPAGSAWLSLVRRTANANTVALLPEQNPRPIVTSPLVIAMPKPMADQLGWSKKSSIGWHDLTQWAKNAPTFWSSKGKKQWGTFTLGKTNPEYSTSGLNATLAAYAAVTGTQTGKARDLTVGDITLRKNTDFVHAIEESVAHYGDTTLTFMQNFRRADDATTPANPDAALRYVSAATVEEQAVVAYNLGYPCGTEHATPDCTKRRTPPHTPLVAFYPNDGTLSSDHPYIEFNNMSPSQRAVADGFGAHLRSRTEQNEFAKLGFRTYNGRTTSYLTQANGALPKAPIISMHLPEGDVLRQLLTTWPTLRRQANVLTLIDTSTSMKNPAVGTAGRTKMNLLKSAGPQLFGRDGFTDNDQVGLWQFGAVIDQNVPGGPLKESVDGVPRRTALTTTLGTYLPQGDTPLYECIRQAVTALRARYDPKAINAVIVLTDGQNYPNKSGEEAALLRTLAATPQIRVFPIAYGNPALRSGSTGLQALQRIAAATGGHVYDATDATTIPAVLTSVVSNF
ncbi:substrate-binding domain-containing protein [Streptomyces adustus]|uniref:caspase, EACC1-associated type n=1 Tax=Streptomyces adustus TaxID=1609272 RepID=UPI0035DA0238